MGPVVQPEDSPCKSTENPGRGRPSITKNKSHAEKLALRRNQNDEKRLEKIESEFGPMRNFEIRIPLLSSVETKALKEKYTIVPDKSQISNVPVKIENGGVESMDTSEDVKLDIKFVPVKKRKYNKKSKASDVKMEPLNSTIPIVPTACTPTTTEVVKRGRGRPRKDPNAPRVPRVPKKGRPPVSAKPKVPKKNQPTVIAQEQETLFGLDTTPTVSTSFLQARSRESLIMSKVSPKVFKLHPPRTKLFPIEFETQDPTCSNNLANPIPKSKETGTKLVPLLDLNVRRTNENNVNKSTVDIHKKLMAKYSKIRGFGRYDKSKRKRKDLEQQQSTSTDNDSKQSKSRYMTFKELLNRIPVKHGLEAVEPGGYRTRLRWPKGHKNSIQTGYGENKMLRGIQGLGSTVSAHMSFAEKMTCNKTDVEIDVAVVPLKPSLFLTRQPLFLQRKQDGTKNIHYDSADSTVIDTSKTADAPNQSSLDRSSEDVSNYSGVLRGLSALRHVAVSDDLVTQYLSMNENPRKILGDENRKNLPMRQFGHPMANIDTLLRGLRVRTEVEASYEAVHSLSPRRRRFVGLDSNDAEVPRWSKHPISVPRKRYSRLQHGQLFGAYDDYHCRFKDGNKGCFERPVKGFPLCEDHLKDTRKISKCVFKKGETGCHKKVELSPENKEAPLCIEHTTSKAKEWRVSQEGAKTSDVENVVHQIVDNFKPNYLRCQSPYSDSRSPRAGGEEVQKSKFNSGATKMGSVIGCQFDDESDEETLISEPYDALLNSGYNTTEEMVQMLRTKLKKLQDLYTGQLYMTKKLYLEGRRKYLVNKGKLRKRLSPHVYTSDPTVFLHKDYRGKTDSGYVGEQVNARNEIVALLRHHGYSRHKLLRRQAVVRLQEVIASDKSKNQRAEDPNLLIGDDCDKEFYEHFIPKKRSPNDYSEPSTCIYSDDLVKCHERVFPLLDYCRHHILHDPNQKFYGPCNRKAYGKSTRCGNPVNITEITGCNLHTSGFHKEFTKLGKAELHQLLQQEESLEVAEYKDEVRILENLVADEVIDVRHYDRVVKYVEDQGLSCQDTSESEADDDDEMKNYDEEMFAATNEDPSLSQPNVSESSIDSEDDDDYSSTVPSTIYVTDLED